MMLRTALTSARKAVYSRVSYSAVSAKEVSPLTDTFGRFHNYLRISLTEKCNLRCTYCMPEEGVNLTPKAHLMSLSERKRLISIFASLGVQKLRFTGGEPTISNQLQELIQHAKSCDIHSIGITSNGIVLKDKLDPLIQAGLSSVNISLDTLSDTKFATITRRDKKNIFRVLSSVYAAVSKGIPVKINCVLMRGFNDNEIADFVNLTKAVNVDVRFIELMPFDGNSWKQQDFMSYIEAIDRLKEEHGIVLTKEFSKTDKATKKQPNPSITSTTTACPSTTTVTDSNTTTTVSTIKHQFDPSDTTKWYRASPEHLGRVGFITSMSSNFCGTCNRLRVTADGQLKVCLFGMDGLDLLQCMRDGDSDDAIVSKLSGAVKQKKASLGGHTSASEIASHSASNRPMILIGG
eukprot:gene11781-13674_t